MSSTMSNVSLSESQSVVFSVVVKSFVIGVAVGTAEAGAFALGHFLLVDALTR